MPLLFFLIVLAFPPLMVWIPTLNQPAEAATQGMPGLGMALLVEAVLLVGYGLSCLERRRLHAARDVSAVARPAQRVRRFAVVRVSTGH